jgi:hypothetical protein
MPARWKRKQFSNSMVKDIEIINPKDIEAQVRRLAPITDCGKDFGVCLPDRHA